MVESCCCSLTEPQLKIKHFSQNSERNTKKKKCSLQFPCPYSFTVSLITDKAKNDSISPRIEKRPNIFPTFSVPFYFYISFCHSFRLELSSYIVFLLSPYSGCLFPLYLFSFSFKLISHDCLQFFLCFAVNFVHS